MVLFFSQWGIWQSNFQKIICFFLNVVTYIYIYIYLCIHLWTRLGINLTKELDSRYSSQKDFLHKVFPWYGEAYDYESWQTISVLSPVCWNTHYFLVCILAQAQWKSHVAPSRAGGPSLKKSAEYPQAFAAFVMRNHIAAWWSRGVLGTLSGCLNMQSFFLFKVPVLKPKKDTWFFETCPYVLGNFSRFMRGVPPNQNRRCPLNSYLDDLLMLSLRHISFLDKPLKIKNINMKGVFIVNGVPHFSLPSFLVYSAISFRCFQRTGFKLLSWRKPIE